MADSPDFKELLRAFNEEEAECLFISLSDLLVNKRAAGRATDLEQLEHLLREMGKKSSD